MEPLLLYFGKMILCSGIMFGYYLLFLKDKTFHHYNRFYLLFLVLISLLLPLVKVSYFTIELNKNFYLLLNQFSNNNLKTQNNDFTFHTIFYTAFGVVSVALLARLILGIFRIQLMKKQFPNEEIEGIRFYQTDLNNAPFSFFRNLFWKKSIEINSPIGKQILKHEMVHIEQKHSWDKLIMQIVKSVFWFNPVFYFTNKEINLIHEYLADNKAVKKSDTKAFAQMLLESHFSGSALPATSPFLSSNLKKRLKMLTQNKTKYAYARKLFALPMLFFIGFAYLVNAKNKEIKETNIAIGIAVEQLKTDTIKPKSNADLDSIARVHQEKVKLHSDALQEDNLKISALSRKINEKSRQLKALANAKKTDSPEFEALQNDMDNLSDQIDNIVNSDNYQSNQKALEDNADAMVKIYDSPEFKKRMADAKKRAAIAAFKIDSSEFSKKIKAAQKRAKEIEARVNSPEFKKRIADAEKKAAIATFKIDSPEFREKIENAQKRVKSGLNINSPEFQKIIKDARKESKDLSDDYGKIYTEKEFWKMIEDRFGKDAFKNGDVAFGKAFSDEDLARLFAKQKRDNDWEKYFPKNFYYNDDFPKDFKLKIDNLNFNGKELSPKERKKLEKKVKELLDKQKDLQKKQRELQQKQQELNREFFKDNSVSLKQRTGYFPDSSEVYVINSDNPGKTEVYINGKKVDYKELKSLNPDKISRMDVFKTDNNGKIEVITK